MNQLDSFLDGARRLLIAEPLADDLQLLLEPLVTPELLLAFNSVPAQADTSPASGWASLNERFTKYRYLRRSAAQDRYLQRLSARFGAASVQQFGFLCCSEAQPRELLAKWLGAEQIAASLHKGLLIANGADELTLAVRCIPYHDRLYAADSRIVEEHGRHHSLAPAHINLQTHENIVWLRRHLRRRRVGRMLEMGSGIGMVSLELADLVGERVGAELSERSHRFSQVNRRLRGDRDVLFVQSNLFANVDGGFDLIFFNPWQPSSSCVDVIEKFLVESLPRLNRDGEIALWVSTEPVPDTQEPVLNAAARFAAGQNLAVERHIIRSWWEGHGVGTISCLVFSRGRKAPLQRTVADLKSAEWYLRRKLASLRAHRA